MVAGGKHFKSKFSKFDYIAIGMTFLLLPLGWILVMVRLFTTNQHNSSKGRNARLVGWALFATYIVVLLLNLLTFESGEQFRKDNLEMALALLIPSFCLLLLAEFLDRRFRQLLRLYDDLVRRKHLLVVNHIASETGQSSAHVTRDLNYMFNEGLLPEGSVENGYLYLESPFGEDSDPEPGADFVTRKPIECPSCGARRSPDRDECEYCGSALNVTG